MTTTLDTPASAVIAANLIALRLRLRFALARATAAAAAITDGNQNLAIGCIFEFEQLLPECEALFRTIMILHRSRDSFEQNEVRS